MPNKETIHDTLTKSRIFPYFLHDSWWLISASVCRRCENDEIESASNLEQLATKIIALSYEDDYRKYDPPVNDMKELATAYNKFQKLDVVYTDDSRIEAREDIWNLVETLTGDELEYMDEQNKKLAKIGNLINRYECFHEKKNRIE